MYQPQSSGQLLGLSRAGVGAGVPGRLLRVGDRNSAELWAKPLADRSFAAVLWSAPPPAAATPAVPAQKAWLPEAAAITVAVAGAATCRLPPQLLHPLDPAPIRVSRRPPSNEAALYHYLRPVPAAAATQTHR